MSEDVDRRSFLKRAGLAAGLGMAVPPTVAACGSYGGISTTSARRIGTLHIPFILDMQVPDPDIFYEGEGLQVTLSAYEGLLQYAPVPPGGPLTYQSVAKRIAPALASAWEVSPDGLTYTFHLRHGVKFHDGTAMDAASWQKSFERRLKVNQGPAYMLFGVASTEAPDPATLVVRLKHPVAPFLDFLACPWSPKAVSPTAVAAHAVGNDLAQKWLSTHDAGTGPYRIAQFIPGSHYTLEAFPGYWGGTSQVKTVVIPIMPDIQTQELEFRNGQLDMLLKGLPIQDVGAFEKSAGVQVKKSAIASNVAMYFNPTKGRLFADLALRKAVRSAVNRKLVVGQAYKDTATVATQFYPAGVLPEGAAPDDPAYDPSILAAMVKSLPTKKVDLAYGLSGGTPYRVMAELIQVELQAAGLNVTARGLETSTEFALNTTPDHQRPDLLIEFWGGDAMHPDSDVRIIFRTGAAPLNWFNYSVPAADKVMDAGSAMLNQDAIIKAYAECAKLITDEALFLNLASEYDVFVARRGITNFVHDPQAVQAVRLADLKRG